jgi:hypothetical protein
MSQKKQGKVCGQTKIAIVALSPSKSEDTSTGSIQQCTQSLSVTHELVLTPLSRPFFPCWEGWDEAVSLKKPIWPRNHVRTSMNDSCCSANRAVVGAFFSPNKQTTPISAHKCCETRGGGGARGLFVCACPQQMFARFTSIVDAQASCRPQAGVVALIVMMLLPSMRRHLCRRCNGVVALVVMALLPSPMCKHLAIVDDDGNGAKGDDDNDGATGDDEDNDPDDAIDNKVDDNDGDGATDNNIDDNCDDTMGNDDDDHDDAMGNDNDDDDATDNDVDNDGDGATGNEVNDDGDSATDDDVIDNCNGATDNDVNDNNGDGATDNNADDDGNGATDDIINNNCNGAMDGEVDNDGDGATGGCHCLDV